MLHTIGHDREKRIQDFKDNNATRIDPFFIGRDDIPYNEKIEKIKKK
jgi:hypothetical protein